LALLVLHVLHRLDNKGVGTATARTAKKRATKIESDIKPWNIEKEVGGKH
jgi:hypothetical protein